MTGIKICILIVIILYLLLVLGIGVKFSHQNDSAHSFYLGGRKLGPLVTAMSAEASDMSSWLLMGLPGVAYLTGVCDAAWTAIGLAVGTYLNWLLVAKRVRVYSHQLRAFTIPDFFSKRFHDNKNSLNCIAAIIIIIFFIPYTASGFAACGKLLNSLFGIDYMLGMIIAAVVIIAYTTLGGFLAASTSDFIQSIVMTIALVTVLVYGINVAGGWDQIMENSRNLPGYLGMNSLHDPATNTASSYGIITIVSTLAWGLGYFGMPHILLRFMGIADENKLKLSRRIASVWVFISLGVAIIIGIVGYSISVTGKIPMFTDAASETIIVQISNLLSTHGIFPAIIAGVILAGILAATMSTSDSQLLAASSSVSQNLLRDVFKMQMSERKAMIIARVTVIIIAIIGIILASNPDSSVFEIVSFAWAGFGATFGPVMLAALFWKRSNKYGALAGMIVGAIVIFVWKFGIRPMGGALDIYELLPAFILACVAIVVVSLVTKAPSKEVTDEYETVQSKL